jgi:hypothetical protein
MNNVDVIKMPDCVHLEDKYFLFKLPSKFGIPEEYNWDNFKVTITELPEENVFKAMSEWTCVDGSGFIDFQRTKSG